MVKNDNIGFSGSSVACDLKVGRYGQLKEFMIFIAPAYSRVRYRSSNFRPSVRSFVRPSVNIYVEV